MKRTKKSSWFSRHRASAAVSILLAFVFVIVGLFTVLRVQTRVQESAVRQRGIHSLRLLVADSSAGLKPDTVARSKAEKFFLLQTMKKYEGQLLRFRFMEGFDLKNLKRRFVGQVQGPGMEHLHDLAARAVVRQGPVVEFDTTEKNNPRLVLALPLPTGDVGIVVRPVDVPPPPAPWLGIFLLLGLAIVLAVVLPPRWAPLGAGGLMALGGALLFAGYRMTTLGSDFAIMGQGFTGLTKGYFPLAWLTLSLVLLGVAALWATGHVGRFFATIKQNRIAYTYILPAMAGMLVLVLLPFAIGLGLGFMNHCNGQFQFIGLSNFWEILSGGGSSITNPLNFYFTLGVTLMWTFLNVFLHVSIGLSLALLLKDPALKMKGIYRVLLIIPWAMPNYITALMWKGMFQQQYGAINILLDNLGIGGISWFSSFWPAFMANVITNTWLGFPFMMVVSLGALQSIPGSLYEAAEVDGASKWQQFKHITLPLLRPALFPSIILGSIWTFNMFNVIYLVSGGEPGGGTDILITEAYQWAFKRGERYGLAAAYATLIFIVLILYSRAANKLSKASEDM